MWPLLATHRETCPPQHSSTSLPPASSPRRWLSPLTAPPPPRRSSRGSRSPNGPWVRASPLPKTVLTWWCGHRGGWGATRQSCGPFWGQQPQGTVWQEQGRQKPQHPPAAAPETPSLPAQGCHPTSHPSSVAQGALLGSLAALGAFKPGSTQEPLSLHQLRHFTGVSVRG